MFWTHLQLVNEVYWVTWVRISASVMTGSWPRSNILLMEHRFFTSSIILLALYSDARCCNHHHILRCLSVYPRRSSAVSTVISQELPMSTFLSTIGNHDDVHWIHALFKYSATIATTRRHIGTSETDNTVHLIGHNVLLVVSSIEYRTRRNEYWQWNLRGTLVFKLFAFIGFNSLPQLPPQHFGVLRWWSGKLNITIIK